MNKFASLLLAGTLVCGAGVCFAQQEKNPNQQQEQTGAKNQPPPSDRGQNTPSPSNPDIPKEKPGTNNPDIAPDSKPAASKTEPDGKNRKSRRRKQTSTGTSSTHTAPTV